jgi:tetratricopeptide (TPR) repeat protein
VSEIGKHYNPKEAIEKWLIAPHTLDEADMGMVNRWLAEFPWFGTLHTLKAVHAKDQGMADYPHHLHRAAITTHDRGWLYEMVNASTDPPQDSAPITTITTPFEIEESKPANITLTDWVDIFLDDATPMATAPTQDEEWGDWSIALEQVAEVKEEISSPIPIEEKENVPEIPSTKIEEEPEVNDYPESVDFAELGELGQDILNKAISSSIELEVSEKETTANEVKSPQPKTETADYGDSFLNFIAASIGLPAEENNAIPHNASPEPEEQKKEDVIERFIQTEPQINRGKAIEYVAGNMAKESLEEDLNLVTETMAKLYVKQGKLDKARKAYKKLIELYPEKSIYFATQLKNLNKKN